MRNLMIGLIGFSMLGLVSAAQAKPEGHGHGAKSQGTEHMSEQGATNTNSPSSGDQLKGDARADERKDMEHDNQSTGNENKGKHQQSGQSMGKKHGKHK